MAWPGWASLGGMFIATPEPPARDSILSLRLYLGDADDAPPVGATAIVRCRRRGEPRGMGPRGSGASTPG